jgi:hypothetical protein
MNHEEPESNPVLPETDSAKTDESIQTSGSEIPANERPSYLRSRQIALNGRPSFMAIANGSFGLAVLRHS